MYRVFDEALEEHLSQSLQSSASQQDTDREWALYEQTTLQEKAELRLQKFLQLPAAAQVPIRPDPLDSPHKATHTRHLCKVPRVQPRGSAPVTSSAIIDAALLATKTAASVTDRDGNAFSALPDGAGRASSTSPVTPPASPSVISGSFVLSGGRLPVTTPASPSVISGKFVLSAGRLVPQSPASLPPAMPHSVPASAASATSVDACAATKASSTSPVSPNEDSQPSAQVPVQEQRKKAGRPKGSKDKKSRKKPRQSEDKKSRPGGSLIQQEVQSTTSSAVSVMIEGRHQFQPPTPLFANTAMTAGTVQPPVQQTVSAVCAPESVMDSTAHGLVGSGAAGICATTASAANGAVYDETSAQASVQGPKKGAKKRAAQRTTAC